MSLVTKISSPSQPYQGRLRAGDEDKDIHLCKVRQLGRVGLANQDGVKAFAGLPNLLFQPLDHVATQRKRIMQKYKAEDFVGATTFCCASLVRPVTFTHL